MNKTYRQLVAAANSGTVIRINVFQHPDNPSSAVLQLVMSDKTRHTQTWADINVLLPALCRRRVFFGNRLAIQLTEYSHRVLSKRYSSKYTIREKLAREYELVEVEL